MTPSALLVAFATLAAAALLAVGIMLIAPEVAARFTAADVSAPMADTIFTVVLFGALLVAGVAGAATTRVNAVAPGRRPVAMLAVGLFVGLFGVTVTTGYSGLAGALQVGEATTTSAALLLWGTAIVLLQAGAEEVYFRGWLQPVLAKAWGIAPAIIVASVAFTLLHILGGARAPLTLVNLFLGGLLFGILAAWGRGILGAVAAHFAWNGAEQLVLGLDPNPGIGSFGSIFNFELTGAQSWGGSEEGLNASYAMTFVLFAMLIPLVVLLRKKLAD